MREVKGREKKIFWHLDFHPETWKYLGLTNDENMKDSTGLIRGTNIYIFVLIIYD